MLIEELDEIIKNHQTWLDGHGGERADLYKANLSASNLSGANLSKAHLSEANLSAAYLSEANLSGAELSGATLVETNLRWANLSCANLSDADLSDADLYMANLSASNLSRAELDGANLPKFQIPQDGELTGYKKLRYNAIARILIPAKARRTGTPIGRKCRAEYAKVLSITKDGKYIDKSYGWKDEWKDERFLYKVGEIVRPDSYDDDIREECTHGIHFFLTREEAEEF